MEAAPPLSGAQAAAVAAHLRRAARAEAAPWLHGEVARRMAARLEIMRVAPTRIVEWWAVLGHGEAVRAHYPQARVDACEPTAALAARSARRPPWWTLQRWRGTAPEVWREPAEPPPGQAQLVWANMLLHWDADPSPRLRRWHAALATDGFVMFSCFGPDTLLALRRLYRRLGWGVAAHDFIDMHDLGDAMVGAGFAEPVMDMERLTLTWADADALVAELRGLGGNAAAARFAGLRTPRWRERLRAELTQELAGPDGRLALGFEIVYGHAFKPPPRLAVAAETRVSVEALRAMARGPRRS
ncbi:MAG TPA: biotin synthase [Methylibium sp.]|nr:biotin synthase [Methylibium sp.]